MQTNVIDQRKAYNREDRSNQEVQINCSQELQVMLKRYIVMLLESNLVQAFSSRGDFCSPYFHSLRCNKYDKISQYFPFYFLLREKQFI